MNQPIEPLLRAFKAEASEGQPVRVEALIEALGIELDARAELEASISGNIQRRSDGTYVIRTNQREHDYRRRFTMAHELGHYILHRSILDQMGGTNDTTMYRTEIKAPVYNSQISKLHEQQANSFAANLLMPEEAVRSAWAKEARISTHPNKLTPLQPLYRKFRVSPSSMKWRLRNLGLSFFE